VTTGAGEALEIDRTQIDGIPLESEAASACPGPEQPPQRLGQATRDTARAGGRGR